MHDQSLYKVLLFNPATPIIQFWLRHISAMSSEEAVAKALRRYPLCRVRRIEQDDTLLETQ